MRQHRAVTTYRIVVEGEISDRFFATFGDMRVDHVAGETWMTGEIADQAQLQGVSPVSPTLVWPFDPSAARWPRPGDAGRRARARTRTCVPVVD